MFDHDFGKKDDQISFLQLPLKDFEPGILTDQWYPCNPVKGVSKGGNLHLVIKIEISTLTLKPRKGRSNTLNSKNTVSVLSDINQQSKLPKSALSENVIDEVSNGHPFHDLILFQLNFYRNNPIYELRDDENLPSEAESNQSNIPEPSVMFGTLVSWAN